MIILLEQECHKHLKLLRSEFSYTLDQLRSQCSTPTFKQIKQFFRDSACELSRELHSWHRKKLSVSTGECVPLTFMRTRHNNTNQLNRSNQPQILVNGSHSPVITSTNHIKAGVLVNRSEIWSNIKEELLGLKWVGKTTRQLITPKESSRLVADCMVSAY